MEDDVIIEPEQGLEGGSEEDIEASESRVGAKADKLKRELEAVKKERQEYLDGWQRAKADYVNALKRIEEERRALTNTGMVKVLTSFLPAYDALERAKASGALPEGFAGIAKQLETAFANFGVVTVGAIGEGFDPAKHEALGTDPSSDSEQDDTVSAVLELGYAMGDTMLRPARVRVFQS